MSRSVATAMVELPDENATETLGQRVAATLRPGDLVALDGELGAGKTTFVRGLARGLGIAANRVSSPTFITMQTYPGDPLALVHVDAWRVTNIAALDSLGWDETLGQPDSVVVVEWASRIESALPLHRLSIRFSFTPDGAARRAEVTDTRLNLATRLG